MGFPAQDPQHSYPNLSLRPTPHPALPKKKMQPAQTPPTLSPVTMIMVYGFMDYLNHVDLPIPHAAVLKKQPYCLMRT